MLSQNSVRDDIGIHGSSECQDEDVGRSGPAQSLCAFIHGGTGREDVVNQKNASVHNRIGASDNKRATKIFQTAFTGQCCLSRRRGDSDQIRVCDGNLEVTPDVISKKQGLIEFALAESLAVQRNRHNHINGMERRKSGDHKSGKRSRQRNFALILQETDGMAQWRRIRVQRPGLRI